jgi:large conductance mechanosensitive channel
MLKEFKDFLFRGNVVDLAVAVVIGAAFGALITSLVENLLTPIIAAIIGEPDFSDLTFTINDSVFRYGAFINALIAFVSIAAAIFFFVVKPINVLSERTGLGRREEETRECPECLSSVPSGATRCAFCTTQISPAGGGPEPAVPR